MKHLFNIKLFAIMGLLFVAVACAENEYITESESSDKIVFSATLHDTENTRSDDDGTTRSAVSDLTDYGFGVSASVYPNNQSYTTNPCGNYFYCIDARPNQPLSYYWPTSDYKMSFYAYYPYNSSAFTVSSLASANGSPTYAYTVPSVIANQKGVMTAQITNHTAGPQSAINLSFSQECAAITFSLTNQRGEAIMIQNIAIEGVKYSGTLKDHTWTLNNGVNSSSVNPFVLTINQELAADATNEDVSGSNIFYMLPQTLVSGAKIILTTSDDAYEAEITGTWQVRKSYNYNITLKPGNIVIDDGTDIADWVDYRQVMPLTFVALEDCSFSFSKAGLSYSLDDGATWTALSAGASTPTVTAGNKIMWKNNTELTPSSSDGIGTFSATGNFDAVGNIMSLYYGDNFANQDNLSGKNYAFVSLFQNCSKIINAENLILPATTLANNCYHHMFQACTNLTTAPELPATTLATNCYNAMFRACTNLTTAPELPATKLVTNCYNSMFLNCTGLTTAPELPATTLASYCYNAMFSGCTNLTTAPELPSKTMRTGCYIEMFQDCTSLITAPELPATTLASRCYNGMFQDCTNLRQVKAAFTTTPGSSYTSSWLSGVSSTGTFYKNAAATWSVTGVNGVPSGWTVITYTP